MSKDDTATLFDRASSAYDRADPQVFATYGRFLYASDDEWWSTLWTIGVRSTLGRMDATVLGRFRTDLSGQMQAFHQRDGVHIAFRVLFAFGVKGQ